MNKIKLNQVIRKIIIKETIDHQTFDRALYNMAWRIEHFVHNNYRRRQYHKKGYSCNTCLKLHPVGFVCKKPKK